MILQVCCTVQLGFMLFYITLSNGSYSEYHKNFFLKEQSVSTSVQSFQFYASYLFLYFGEALLLSLNR